MLSAASLTYADEPSHHRKNPARKLCAFATAVAFALHVKKNRLSLGTEEQMADYNQAGFVSSASCDYKSFVSDVRVPERGENVSEAAMERGEAGAKRGLRPEQKLNFLLRELVSRFRLPGDLVFELFKRTFSTAAACFTEHRH